VTDAAWNDRFGSRQRVLGASTSRERWWWAIALVAVIAPVAAWQLVASPRYRASPRISSGDGRRKNASGVEAKIMACRREIWRKYQAIEGRGSCGMYAES